MALISWIRHLRRRNPSASGFDYVAAVVVRDPAVDSDLSTITPTDPDRPDQILETFAVTGLPMNTVKIGHGIVPADLTGSPAGKMFPDRGAGTLPVAASAGSQIRLADDALGAAGAGGSAITDPTGLLLVIKTAGSGGDAAAVGVVREITGWQTNGSTRVVTLGDPLVAGALPGSGAQYDILFDLRRARRVSVKAEFTANTADLTCTVRYRFFGTNQNAQFVRKLPGRALDIPWSLVSTQVGDDPIESGCYETEPYSKDCEGAMGVKVRVVGLTTGAAAHLFAWKT